MLPLKRRVRRALRACRIKARAAIPRRFRERYFAAPAAIQSTRAYCQHHGLTFTRVSPGDRIQRCPPATPEPQAHWKFLDPGQRTHVPPETWLATIPEARVVTGEAHVLARGGILLADASLELGNGGPHAHTLLTDYLAVPRRQSLSGVSTLASSAEAHSYFHWLLDALPRLGIITAAGMDLSAIDHYLIPRSRLPAIRQSLELLGIESERCHALDYRSSVGLDTLLLPSMPGLTGNPAPWVRDFLRQAFLPAALDVPDRLPRRFFVVRRGTRRILNEAALAPVLERFAIEPVQPERLSFLEQVALFARAELVVAPHGAALANLVFSQGNTSVVELFSPNYVNVCFWAIAQLGGMRYSYLEGEGHRPAAGVDPHAVRDDLVVCPARLSAWLDSWL